MIGAQVCPRHGQDIGEPEVGRNGRHEYEALLAFLGDPASGFITQTLPFDGGFEISVKVT